MNPASLLWLALAALPLTSQAQATTSHDSLRRRGELTGARPSGRLLAQPHAQPTPRRQAGPGNSDPVQQHLLNAEVNLVQARASELPDLYDHFISTTRDEHRRWSFQDWDAAGQVLARLNQRYEQVRTSLPIEERLRIRSYQGEFHTLRGARQMKEKIDN